MSKAPVNMKITADVLGPIKAGYPIRHKQDGRTFYGISDGNGGFDVKYIFDDKPKEEEIWVSDYCICHNGW